VTVFGGQIPVTKKRGCLRGNCVIDGKLGQPYHFSIVSCPSNLLAPFEVFQRLAQHVEFGARITASACHDFRVDHGLVVIRICGLYARFTNRVCAIYSTSCQQTMWQSSSANVKTNNCRLAKHFASGPARASRSSFRLSHMSAGEADAGTKLSGELGRGDTALTLEDKREDMRKDCQSHGCFVLATGHSARRTTGAS
jgi:hypothetical protein